VIARASALIAVISLARPIAFAWCEGSLDKVNQVQL
jgi:hypothetical protein